MNNVPHLSKEDFKGYKLDPKYEENENKNKSKTKPKLSVVMIYANWCGACSRDKPQYSELCDKMSGEGISLFALDNSDGNHPMFHLFEKDFPGYPSYYVFDKDGNKIKRLEKDLEDVKNLNKNLNKNKK